MLGSTHLKNYIRFYFERFRHFIIRFNERSNERDMDWNGNTKHNIKTLTYVYGSHCLKVPIKIQK
jgi:hypothetical protein